MPRIPIFPTLPDLSALATPYLRSLGYSAGTRLVEAANAITTVGFLASSILISVALLDAMVRKSRRKKR
jgi:hypothetical protein